MILDQSESAFADSVMRPKPGSELYGLPEELRRELLHTMTKVIGRARFETAWRAYDATMGKHVSQWISDGFGRVESYDPLVMAEVGKALSPVTRLAPDDSVATFCLDQVVDHGAPVPMAIGLNLHAARWAELNCPIIHLTAKQTSALMLTQPSAEQAPLVRPPWRALVITFEPGAFVATVDGKPTNVERIAALLQHSPWSAEWAPKVVGDGRSRHERWVVRIDAGNRSLWEWQHSTADIIGDDLEESPPDNHPVFEDLDPLEWRAGRMALRLIVSLCLALSDPARKIRVTPEKPKHSKWSLKPYKTYRLDMPVKIDARQWVHDYLRGETAKHRSIRWVVRGHFRNQAVGPGHRDHRLIWIEPFWKGPEDGVTLGRPHVIDDRLTAPPPDPTSPLLKN